jgi:hypothetical protein
VGIILYMAVLAAAIAAVAGMFAEGGRPPVGQLALVGERGPELFVPDRSGTIIPAHVTAGLLRGGTAGGSAGGGPGGGASGSAGRMGVSLAIFDDPSKMAQWTRGQEFETHVVDLVKRNIHLVYRG